MASGHLEWGRALVAERAFEAAREHLTHALVIARDHELTAIKADTLTCMGILEIESVQFSAAQNTLREALTLYQNLQDCKGVSRTLNDLSRIAIERRTYKEAKQYAEEALSLAQTLGDHREQSNALRNIGTVAREEGRYAAASLNCEQALTIARNAGDLQRECEMLIELAILHLQDGKNEEAWKRGLLAVELARILNLPFHEGRAWLIAGHAFAEFKLFDQALQAYESALNLRSGMAQQGLVHEPLAGMARVYFSQGDIVQARILIEHILDHLNAEEQHKTSQTLRVYLTCYQVLEANDDPRASDILMKAAQIYGTGDQAMLGSAL
jgi:tetratricopeptide (TPR) repeat protein